MTQYLTRKSLLLFPQFASAHGWNGPRSAPSSGGHVPLGEVESGHHQAAGRQRSRTKHAHPLRLRQLSSQGQSKVGFCVYLSRKDECSVLFSCKLVTQYSPNHLSSLATLIQPLSDFISPPPFRFGDEEMAKFKMLVMDKRPEAKKKVQQNFY